MQIKFIGTGGAFDPDYLNSAAIIRYQNQNILIDCGHAIYPTLVKKELVDTIDAVLITHLHDDHVGSLSTLLIHYALKNRRIKLLYPDEAFRTQLYNLLSFSMLNPDAFSIDFEPISGYDNIEYLDTLGLHIPGMQSYSYIFHEGGKSVAYSGDLGECHPLFQFLKSKQSQNLTVFHDVSFDANNPAHAYYKEVEPYLTQFNIFGYHCNPSQNPPDNQIPLVYYTPLYLF